MNKRIYLLVFLLLPCLAFAQSNLPFTSLKPLNKGNIILNLGYERDTYNDVSKFCLSAGYGFTDWCVAGIYTEYSTNTSMISIGGDDLHPYRNHFVYYGLHNELHPIPLVLPGFYFIDVYSILRVGMHHQICIYEEDNLSPDYNTPSINKPYIAGGIGLAINPSKYFGFFYERTYSSLKPNTFHENASNKLRPYNRFGINIRFGGPKKWQK